MTNNKTKVVVFDFDGTLVNSMEAFADIAARVMPKYLPIDSKAARQSYLETSGIPFFEQLEVMFPKHPANKKAAEEFEKIKLENYFEEPLFDDVKETIEYLKKTGTKVAVSSNNFQELVDKFVGQTGIKFDMVLGFKDNFAKGNDHFAHIEKTLGVNKADITFVGDSIKDGERAGSYGVSFIAKEGTFNKKEFAQSFPKAKVIKNLSDLKKMF